MQFILPPTIALKTVYPGNCLNYCNDSDSETHGCLKFNGANAFSLLAKFEVVPANTGTGLVHIKCSHNKKFLRRLREGDAYLSPEADDPEERDNKWWCTLFKPQVAEDGNPDNARLFHVEGQRWAAVHNEEVRLCIDNEGGTVFHIVDWESLVILPPTISLKSSFYGDYLNYSDDSDSKTHGFLKFKGANVFSSFAKFEVVPANTGKGLVHIRCSQNRKFLQSRAAYISPEAEEQEEDQFK